MSVSAETYIVISLMFAVFAAIAAVGTSVVLGAGFERLRAGFEIVKNQSGFFADAIYKLDVRTQKLDEETAKLKSGYSGLDKRVERTEKTATFLADSINTLEQRILHGTPVAAEESKEVSFVPVHVISRHTGQDVEKDIWQPLQMPKPLMVPTQDMMAPSMTDGHDEEVPSYEQQENPVSDNSMLEDHDVGQGFTTLLSRYFSGETSGTGRAVVYH